MSVEHVECKEEGVLGVVEERNDINVHHTDHHGNPGQHQQEAHLSETHTHTHVCTGLPTRAHTPTSPTK